MPVKVVAGQAGKGHRFIVDDENTRSCPSGGGSRH